MESLKFSVSMCVYGKDNPNWFEIAVNSILNQTIKPDEVVLVVDGPVSNDLKTIIEEYEKNKLFKIIRFETNQGHGNARRAGLEACANELVAIMDADDISLPNRFELQIEKFKTDPELAIVGGSINEFIEDVSYPVATRTVPTSDEDIKLYMKKRCPMNQMTVMFKKSQILSVGGYVDWFCEEDYYLWLRMALANMKFANVDETLVNVRVGADMYRRRGGWKYFKSEAKLQKYMKKNKIIGLSTYFSNVIKRFIVQVLMPNKLRGWVFKKFARKKVKNG